MRKPCLLFIFGTRPEAIKLAPLIIEFRKSDDYDVKICVTAQHRHMLDQVLSFFGLVPDVDLNLMKKGQTLFEITATGLASLEGVLDQLKPDMVFVQGDTTTTFAGALSAYYKKVPVCHVEAGLRSRNKYSPFPEEMNRAMTSVLSDFHFAPTDAAVENLRRENIRQEVYKVGNTGIDALMLGLDLLKNRNAAEVFPYLSKDVLNSRFVLITGHRRESFGEPFEQICLAIADLARQFPEVAFVYPVHLNPNVKEPVQRILSTLDNVHLLEPVEYPAFIFLMSKCHLVLTDSGGLQEEAPSLGKPVLVMRNVTERQEGIDSGNAKLVGTGRDKIVEETGLLLEDESEYRKMAKAVNPYGDGTACRQIVAIMKDKLNVQLNGTR